MDVTMCPMFAYRYDIILAINIYLHIDVTNVFVCLVSLCSSDNQPTDKDQRLVSRSLLNLSNTMCFESKTLFLYQNGRD